MYVKYSILLFIGGVIGLMSCKNNDNVFKPAAFAHINFVNASTDTLNIYVNGSRQNNNSSIYPAGQSYYLNVPDDLQNYQFKKAGSPVVLFSIPLTLKDSSYTSIYVYGGPAPGTITTNDLLFKYTAFPDTTQIRFINLSPDAGSLDIFVGDTLSFKSQAFKSSTMFGFTGGGKKDVKVYQAGTAVLLKDTSLTFQRGAIYTLFSKGLTGGKGNAAFGVGLVINSN